MGEIAEEILGMILEGGFEEEEEDFVAPTPSRTCKFCGKTGLRWISCGTEQTLQWRLVESDNQLHVCPQWKKNDV
jgi:hypothetical protein